jgi:glyoxylase-like metal-dependent hydrolase (beta-lactamase superfamily II)
MPINDHLENAKHFNFEQLTTGVYACIHKPGGFAFSNAGIIDLGDRTIVVDACETLAAGRELRLTAESLFDRQVDTIVQTHWHHDHWIGASSFDPNTRILCNEITQKMWAKESINIVESFKDPSRWEEEIRIAREKLITEQDERVRVGLGNSILRKSFVLAEMAAYQPRVADQTFDKEVTLQGSKRTAKVTSLGRGHSQDDTILTLPEENIAFIGDIGFFDCQPYMGSCDLDLYRQQLKFIQAAEIRILIPGHGPVGNIEKDISAQLTYLDVMGDLVGNIVKRGGSFEEAMQIYLPEPFDKWLTGGMSRFETNVRYLYAHFGGEIT